MGHKYQKNFIAIISAVVLLSIVTSCSGVDLSDSLLDNNYNDDIVSDETSATAVLTEANTNVPETSSTIAEIITAASVTTTSAAATTTAVVTTTPIVSTSELTISSFASTDTPKTTTESIEIVTYAPKVESTGITLIYFDSNLVRNQDATITVKGKPNTQYTIEVYYSSGPSKAKGLENKYSDADGVVSWTWHVGGKTKLGDNKDLVIIGGGEKYTTTFAVID